MKRTHGLIGTAMAAGLAIFAVQAANIPETATQAGNFQSLLKATETAGLSGYVGGQGPFTIFAPNDAAFAKVPKAKLDMLMKPENRTMLKVTLGNHLVTGMLPMAAIDGGLGKAEAVSVMAINNMPLVIKRDGDGLTVNGARVMGPPMQVDNGLVYVVDTMMLPAMPLQPTY